MPTLTLSSPVREVPGVGEVLARRLKLLNITTCGELLWHLPFRYDDFRTLTTIARLRPDTKVTIRARVNLIQNRRSPRKRMMVTEGLFSDASGSVKAVWFRQPFVAKNLASGDEVFLSGSVVQDAFGLQFQNPTYERATSAPNHTARLVPIYPATDQLSQKHLRMMIARVLPLAAIMPEPLPESVLSAHRLPRLSDAIQRIHRPEAASDAERARRRLALDELLVVQLANLQLRGDLTHQRAEAIPFAEHVVQELVRKLPFQLTTAQRKCAWQILKDLTREQPMNRLLEGDVGSGKTIVAVIASVNAITAQKQVCYMAPTEILARQQYQTFREFFPDRNVALRTSSRTELNGEELSPAELERRIGGNDVDVTVGTHALLSDNVRFLDLGLAIIDEQHRFGVKQRKHLREISGNPETLPHLLSMTATPIPRTLALTLFGDLDLSILDELPSNRKPIVTERVSLSDMSRMFERVYSELAAHHRVFVVCPLISDSDLLRFSSAETVYEEWRSGPLRDYRTGLLHGKLKSSEKESIMGQFQRGELDVLIATAVIEVGVDISEATVMIIRGAERFGLAQLHQLRGRIGRSEHASYCFVIPDDDNAGRERLTVFARSTNGFELAEFDLKTRGPGDVYGTRQSGMPDLHIASLSDHALIAQTQQIAQELYAQDTTLGSFPGLPERVETFLRNLHLE